MPDRSPSTTKGAFHCPHCGVYAKQRWMEVGGCYLHGDELPQTSSVLAGKVYKAMTTNPGETPNPLQQQKHSKPTMHWRGPQTPKVKRRNTTSGELPMKLSGNVWAVSSVFLSECTYEDCRKISVWLDERLLFPEKSTVSAPNPDLSDELKADYLEAASIVSQSPRGAAALLRLCIQKLCNELTEKKDTIDKNIQRLVDEHGLDIEVQTSLDAIRVIGNESVHPGELNMQDNHDTAVVLFDLVNFIAQQMLTAKRKRKEFQDNLPASVRAKIERRNAKQPI
ncbi:DUF4145 domain-containing protein [Pseudooceanicola sp. LIPI14-2-Ac024]|uniref:DUF4145 domain-containing protein n=1 Tax=Pseudooceanicola sp. LIPI14-2-Ac024 TaxID=3344875 RepID=UPI0035CF0D6D